MQKYYRTLGFAAVYASLWLVGCQPNDFAPGNSNPSDLVQFNSDAASARAAANGKYIVTLKSGSVGTYLPDNDKNYDSRSQRMRALIAQLIGRSTADRAEEVYSKALKGFSARLTPAEVASLRQSPYVESVEADVEISLSLPSGSAFAQPAQETPWGITRVGGPTNYQGTNVAWILDTGIDLEHPDLNVDAASGYNFTNARRSPDDDNGHGSHVAGTVAAINNSIGVVGVAAGATVVPVKVLNSRGGGSYTGILAGVDYVATKAKPGDVANMSLGGPAYKPLDDAILAAASTGIYFVLAAGNEAQNSNNVSPARVNGPNIFTISAINSSDVFASFSNYANPPVDYAAPGVSIKSTWKYGDYRTISGTSMAAPHVSGILLATGGVINTSGTAKNDPDGTPDPIAHK